MHVALWVIGFCRMMFYPIAQTTQTIDRHEKIMTKAALSLYMYGLYLVTGVGLPFLIIPHFTLGMFGMSAGDDMWIRFVGILAGTIGAFYVAAVLTRMEQMYAWSVPARYVSATFMAVMVLLGKVGLALLIFSALDALTASITWLAIRADKEAEVPA